MFRVYLNMKMFAGYVKAFFTFTCCKNVQSAYKRRENERIDMKYDHIIKSYYAGEEVLKWK